MCKKIMNKPIAHTKLTGITAEGEKQKIEIIIGTPYKVEHNDDLEEWACPVSLMPLYKNLHDAHGGDSFQALCLAASLIINLLTAYKEKGGRLVIDGGDDFPLESYWFGQAKST